MGRCLPSRCVHALTGLALNMTLTLGAVMVSDPAAAQDQVLRIPTSAEAPRSLAQLAAELGEEFGAGFEEAFSLGLLEPAAGEAAPPMVSPTAPLTPAPGAVSLDITELPRVRLAPENGAEIALPPPRQGQAPAQTPAQPTGSPTVPMADAATRPLSAVFPQGARGQQLGQQRGGAGASPAEVGIFIEENPLGDGGDLVSLAAYGPLPTAGALTDDLWLRAALPTQVGRLEQALARPVQSVALREAWRQILLTGAAVPVGQIEGRPDTHWLTVRAEALERIEQHEAAWSLWREARGLVRDPAIPPALVQGWTRAGLLAGQGAQVCPLVREQAAAGMVSDFWPAAAAVCAAIDLPQTNSAAALALAIQLLPNDVASTDPALLEALRAVRDGEPPRLQGWPIGPLAGAALATMPAQLGAEVMRNLPDVALRRIRATPGLPESAHQQAALALLQHVVWPQDRQEWLALASSPTYPALPQESWPDPATVAWAQAWPLQALVQAAEASPTLVPELASPSLAGADLGVTPTMPAAAAARVVPAALRLGDLPLALTWWPAYQNMTDLSDAARRDRWQAFMALRLQQAQPIAPEHLAAWEDVRAAGQGTTPDQMNLANQRTLAVLEGMGQTVPPAAWEGLEQGASGADALNLAWQRLLEAAATNRDIPGTLSLITQGLQGRSPAAASPAVLRASLLALRQLGWPELAAQLATEALTLAPQPQRGGAVLQLAPPPAASPPAAAKPVSPSPPAAAASAPPARLPGPLAPTPPQVRAPSAPTSPPPAPSNTN